MWDLPKVSHTPPLRDSASSLPEERGSALIPIVIALPLVSIVRFGALRIAVPHTVLSPQAGFATHPKGAYQVEEPPLLCIGPAPRT
ncbi:hypothetical protein JCGZ_02829 [Jatropha curcas]|uniref:Uncharacterized protein n=1 Tax=Jatropha curcas TaxID=180498 RepID=A0A067JFL8_JATCU|nr:hypothetical protein JCGZ_02829 [Jatropha curcas]